LAVIGTPGGVEGEHGDWDVRGGRAQPFGQRVALALHRRRGSVHRVLAERQHRAQALPVVTRRRPGAPDDRHVGAVGPADAPAGVLDDLAAQRGPCQGEIGGRAGRAVRGGIGDRVGRPEVEPLDAVEPRGGLVGEGDAALDIGDDQPRIHLRQRGLQQRVHGWCRRHRRLRHDRIIGPAARAGRERRRARARSVRRRSAEGIGRRAGGRGVDGS
jgi:hypothetical protein